MYSNKIQYSDLATVSRDFIFRILKMEQHNWDIYRYPILSLLGMHDRKYEKKMQTVEKFIKKYGTSDHMTILNEIDIDYDTLMKILSELSNKGRLKSNR